MDLLKNKSAAFKKKGYSKENVFTIRKTKVEQKISVYLPNNRFNIEARLEVDLVAFQDNIGFSVLPQQSFNIK